MGRLFLQYLSEDGLPKYICNVCRIDLASSSSLIWEGFMGAQQPANLFRRTVNIDPCSNPREERLSTGLYTLVDVRCRSCCTPLGWQYLKASSQDQIYKEGSTLLQQDLLIRCDSSQPGNGTGAAKCLV